MGGISQWANKPGGEPAKERKNNSLATNTVYYDTI